MKETQHSGRGIGNNIADLTSASHALACRQHLVRDIEPHGCHRPPTVKHDFCRVRVDESPIPIRVRALAGSGLDVEPENELVEDIRTVARVFPSVRVIEGWGGNVVVTASFRASPSPAELERRARDLDALGLGIAFPDLARSLTRGD